MPCPVADCHKRVDVSFVIDSANGTGPSGGSGADAGAAEWRATVAFVQAVIERLDVGLTGVNVGVVKYSSLARVEFYLYEYVTHGELQQAVGRITQTDAGANVAAGLRVARQQLYRQRAGNRPEAPDVMVVVTDDATADAARARREANLAAAQGVRLVAVGVGSRVSVAELRELASDPEAVFHVDTHHMLRAVVDRVVADVMAGVDEICPKLPEVGEWCGNGIFFSESKFCCDDLQEYNLQRVSYRGMIDKYCRSPQRTLFWLETSYTYSPPWPSG